MSTVTRLFILFGLVLLAVDQSKAAGLGDECQNNGDCSAAHTVCATLSGGDKKCSCDEGYKEAGGSCKMNVIGDTCDSMSDCQLPNSMCETLEDGSKKCGCLKGYSANDDGDECTNNEPPNGAVGVSMSIFLLICCIAVSMLHM